MKRFLMPTLVMFVALFVLCVHVAYRAGQRAMRDFETLCREPGVRCVVELSPAYLVRHSGVDIPESMVGEWAEGDGRMQ